MKILILSLMMAFSAASYAAILCPPDSCNPFNGCIDGCSTTQKRCSPSSVQACVGQELYSVCQISSQPHQQPVRGYCSAVGVSNDQPNCACD